MNVPKEDSFKWFGEGFDGFPKRLPDDTLEYTIYVVDSDISDSLLREKLRAIQAAGTALTKKLLKGFIWQRDSFNLELVREDGLSFLRGRTCYGDSVEDEWLLVYLLHEISKQFPEAWFKLTDTDGEFLLIEAANALPKWLNPDVADNRVWLSNGQLLIIPSNKKSKSSQVTASLSLKSALSTLASTPRSSLLHARLIEEEAFYRLRNYPSQIQSNLHHALITLPRRALFILHSNPAYISPAVEAFYLRDPIALKPLQATSDKGLVFPPEDLVTARVKFTKVGYAQLRSQVFPAPGLWARALAPNAGSTAKKRQEIGMKVACGLEMLLADPENQDRKVVREIKMLLEDLEVGEETLPSDQEIREWGLSEDDEAWLDIDFRDLENELQGGNRKGEGTNGAQSEFGDKAAQENLKKMVQRFEEFLNDDELEDMDEDDDKSTEPSDVDEHDDAEDKDASFDEDEFTAMMREMMGMPKEVMEEIMGPRAAKARGVAREDGSTDPKVLDTQKKPSYSSKKPDDASITEGVKTEKPVFGPERPPHMQKPDKPQSHDKDEEDVEEIPRVDNKDSDDEHDEEEIRELSAAFEAELRRAGALSLDGKEPKGKGKAKITVNDAHANTSTSNEGDDDSEGEHLDENYNLISNMLESFKSQGGLSGPGGNMLGMMGMKLPRDDERASDSKTGGHTEK